MDDGVSPLALLVPWLQSVILLYVAKCDIGLLSCWVDVVTPVAEGWARADPGPDTLARGAKSGVPGSAL